jgi:molybdopterin synthase sulfur carrier subunit
VTRWVRWAARIRCWRRLFDETGRLRRYVNVYLDGVDVRIGDGMDTPVSGGAELLVLPSVAGG